MEISASFQHIASVFQRVVATYKEVYVASSALASLGEELRENEFLQRTSFGYLDDPLSETHEGFVKNVAHMVQAASEVLSQELFGVSTDCPVDMVTEFWDMSGIPMPNPTYWQGRVDDRLFEVDLIAWYRAVMVKYNTTASELSAKKFSASLVDVVGRYGITRVRDAARIDITAQTRAFGKGYLNAERIVDTLRVLSGVLGCLGYPNESKALLEWGQLHLDDPYRQIDSREVVLSTGVYSITTFKNKVRFAMSSALACAVEDFLDEWSQGEVA